MVRRLPPCVTVALVLLTGTSGAASPTWTATGAEGSEFELSGSPGIAPTLHYSMDPAGFEQRRWSLMTESDVSGRVGLQFHYHGFHAYFDVTVFLTAIVVHEGRATRTVVLAAGPAVCCSSPSEAFDYQGTVGLKVQRGDRYGFEFGGSNGDSANRLTGTLQVIQRPMLSGNWRTSHGSMRLDQSRGVLTGTYASCDGEATIRGRLRGNVLYGFWEEPCEDRAGRLQFVFDRGSMNFKGTWSRGSAEPTRSWTGRRV